MVKESSGAKERSSQAFPLSNIVVALVKLLCISLFLHSHTERPDITHPWRIVTLSCISLFSLSSHSLISHRHQVCDLEEVAVADIAAGGWHSMALTADGQIYVWGRCVR